MIFSLVRQKKKKKKKKFKKKKKKKKKNCKQTELLRMRKSYKEKNTVHDTKLIYLIKPYIYYQKFEFNHVNNVNIEFLFCNMM